LIGRLKNAVCGGINQGCSFASDLMLIFFSTLHGLISQPSDLVGKTARPSAQWTSQTVGVQKDEKNE